MILMFDTGITHKSHPSFPLVKVETLDDLDDLDGHGTCCAGITCGSLEVYNVNGVANANLMIWKACDYICQRNTSRPTVRRHGFILCT